MKKHNILLVSNSTLSQSGGGVAAVIRSIIKSLHSKFNFDCVVFIKPKSQDNVPHVTQHYLKYCYAWGNIWKRRFVLFVRPFSLYWGVYRLCKTHTYHAIHCHNEYDQWICLMAAKHAGVEIRIAHSHNTNTPAKLSVIRRIYYTVSKKLINRYASDRVGCSAKACIDFFGKGVPSKIIYNAIDLTKFNIKKHTSFQNKRFIHVGRYCYQKNQEFLLDVFYLLHKKFPDISLTLVGQGPGLTLIEKKISQYDLDKCIQLVDGRIADIPSLYAQADYMIFPSRYEGFGIVLIEAQSMGIHCFVSEAIQPEADAGLLTFLRLSDGPQKWADIICEHLHNSDLTLNINETAFQRYSLDTIAQQYFCIYNGV